MRGGFAEQASCGRSLARRAGARQSLLRFNCTRITDATRTASQRHRHCRPSAELVSPANAARRRTRGRGRRSPMLLMTPRARPPRSAASGSRNGLAYVRTSIGIALLALLAQSSLPHLHQWLASRHANDGVQATAEGAASTLAAATGADARCTSGHTESGCPTCQALAQSRLFVSSAAVPPRPLAVAIPRPHPLPAHAAATRPVAHAPRSPPSPA